MTATPGRPTFIALFWLTELGTGRVLGQIDPRDFPGLRPAAQVAGTQARRLARGGIAVLLVGPTGSRAYVPEDRLPDVEREAPVPPTPADRPRCRRRRRTSEGQLVLPFDAELVAVARNR